MNGLRHPCDYLLGDWIMVGRTDGGRVLTIVVELLEEAQGLRPITGWPSSTGEQTRYLRRRP
jgi:hypothetical protein